MTTFVCLLVTIILLPRHREQQSSALDIRLQPPFSGAIPANNNVTRLSYNLRRRYNWSLNGARHSGVKIRCNYRRNVATRYTCCNLPNLKPINNKFMHLYILYKHDERAREKTDSDILVNSRRTSKRDMREGCLRVGRRFVRVITIRYIYRRISR